MRRISWFLFFSGVALGFIFGLYYAWEISPIDPKDARPTDLEPQFQVEYETLIALAYVNTGNISRAVRRVDEFPGLNSADTLQALAQQLLADGRSEEDVLAVAQLASALSNPTKPTPIPQKAQITATPTIPPTSTQTPLPIQTQTSTPIPVYQLYSQEKICDPAFDPPLIQVLIFDAAGDPVPGVEVLIIWGQGEDHFFTGLKSEIDPGYGDFAMNPGITYSVLIAGSGQTITDLESEECTRDDEVYPGSWLLTFEKQ
jgi:hypothetical protein